MQNVIHNKDNQIQILKKKLSSHTDSDGIKLDELTQRDILTIMNRHKDKYPKEDNSFAAIFWNQQ